MRARPPTSRRQRGATAVEFALTVIIFLSLTFAVIEFARFMFLWTTAVEATRLGARVAVVCDANEPGPAIARMRELMPLLSEENIEIDYPALTCSAANCPPVTVRLQNVSIPLIIPVLPISLPLPELATSLPAESMDSTDNALCR